MQESEEEKLVQSRNSTDHTPVFSKWSQPSRTHELSSLEPYQEDSRRRILAESYRTHKNYTSDRHKVQPVQPANGRHTYS